MKKILWILGLTSLLTACSYLHSGKSEDHIARCEELKHQLIYKESTKDSYTATLNTSTQDQLIAAQQNASMDNVEREFRELDCS